MAGPSQEALAENAGEIDERPRDGRYRDSAASGRVLCVKAPDSMRGHSSESKFHERDHLGSWRRSFDQSPQMACGASSQESPIAAREHRGEIRGLHTRRLVADPVDARMD